MGNASYRGARTLPVLLVIGAVAEFLVLGVPGRAKRSDQPSFKFKFGQDKLGTHILRKTDDDKGRPFRTTWRQAVQTAESRPAAIRCRRSVGR